MSDRVSERDAPTGLEPRYPEGYWDGGADYLRQTALLQHNPDYLAFLVDRVWQLDRPCRLVEFGCGAGKMGLLLMPLLAPGSSYTGIDLSAQLIGRGQQAWSGAPYEAAFQRASIFSAPFAAGVFDVALVHTVLMHVPRPERALAEMVRVTRPGGLVIACEANRNTHTALLHIDETAHQETVPLALFQTLNRAIREQTGVDYNIGAKMPVLMHRAGLEAIELRISDAARCLFPPFDSEGKRRLFQAICDEGYGAPRPTDAERARWKEALLRRGISEVDAEAEIDRELDEDFLNKGPGYHTVYASVLTWAFGTVPGR